MLTYPQLNLDAKERMRCLAKSQGPWKRKRLTLTLPAPQACSLQKKRKHFIFFLMLEMDRELKSC